MAEDFVFPEDTGTGAPGGDNADAANFATLAFDGERRNHQIIPFGLTADFANDTLTIGEGLCVVSDDSAQEAQSTLVRDQGVRYAVILDERTGLSIGQHRQEAVFLSVDLTSDDTVGIVIQEEPDKNTITTPELPPKPRLKIGVIDNDVQTTFETNTEEKHRHQSRPVRSFIRAGESVSIPKDFDEIFADDVTVDGELIIDGTIKTI